jgi:hypothetical protein
LPETQSYVSGKSSLNHGVHHAIPDWSAVHLDGLAEHVEYTKIKHPSADLTREKVGVEGKVQLGHESVGDGRAIDLVSCKGFSGE